MNELNQCPICQKPYEEHIDTDDYTEGQLDSNTAIKPWQRVCYNVAAYPEVYHGFTLYIHPQRYLVGEEKWEDGEWRVREESLHLEGLDGFDTEGFGVPENCERRIREVEITP